MLVERLLGGKGDTNQAVKLLRAFTNAGLVDVGALRQEVAAPEEWPDESLPSGAPDERWRLWRDLRAAALQEPHHVWKPLELRSVFDKTCAPLPSLRVTLSFDSRMPASQVKAEIDRLWERMTNEGWVRRTRPLKKKAADLIRFVCLERTDLRTWDERVDAWSAKVGSDVDKRALYKEFQRAEEQLTGEKGGLAWFYCEEARSQDRPEAAVKMETQWRERMHRDVVRELLREVAVSMQSAGPQERPGMVARAHEQLGDLAFELESLDTSEEAGGLGLYRMRGSDAHDLSELFARLDRFEQQRAREVEEWRRRSDELERLLRDRDADAGGGT